jgi:hypothetical protein
MRLNPRSRLHPNRVDKCPVLRTGETSIRPLAYPLNVPMFYGVPMDIIHMPVEIFGVTNGMFPKPPLPNPVSFRLRLEALNFSVAIPILSLHGWLTNRLINPTVKKNRHPPAAKSRCNGGGRATAPRPRSGTGGFGGHERWLHASTGERAAPLKSAGGERY